MSAKGNELLLLNDFNFSRGRVTKCGKFCWRRNNKKCPSQTDAAEDEITAYIGNKFFRHNHMLLQISNVLERKALGHLIERPLKLIRK